MPTCSPGSSVIRDLSRILFRPVPAGSTWWNVGLENSPPKPSDAAHSPASRTWSRPSRDSCRHGTKIPDLSSGPQPSSPSRPSSPDAARLSSRSSLAVPHLEPEKRKPNHQLFLGHHTSCDKG